MLFLDVMRKNTLHFWPFYMPKIQLFFDNSLFFGHFTVFFFVSFDGSNGGFKYHHFYGVICHFFFPDACLNTRFQWFLALSGNFKKSRTQGFKVATRLLELPRWPSHMLMRTLICNCTAQKIMPSLYLTSLSLPMFCRLEKTGCQVPWFLLLHLQRILSVSLSEHCNLECTFSSADQE